MLRGAREADDEWRPILDVLSTEPVYERRLDAVLARVSELSQLPECHLYLTAEDGDRFHLERSRRSHGARGAAPAVPRFDQMDGSGVDDMAASASLDLAQTEEDRTDRTVSTLRGRFFSLALSCGDELIGVLHVGPLARDEVPTKLRRHLEAIRFPLALVVRQARHEHTVNDRLAALSARVEVGRRLQVSALDLDRFVELLLDLALKATHTEAGFVAIGEPGSDLLAIRAQVNLPAGFVEQTDLSPATGLFDWSPAAEGGGLVLRDFDAATRLGIRSLLAVPLFEESEPVGIFALVNFSAGGTFQAENLELLATFSEQITLMLHNGRLFQHFAERYIDTIKGLARSLDVRRAHTHGHHDKVAHAAATIGQELSLSPVEFEAVRDAALIHDVGMAGIVKFEGGFQADLEHPTVGASLVEHLPLHPWVAGSVATHHEWFDGWGSPVGLKGDDIPLGGRILALAVFLVEMAAGDPVRPAWPPERLAEELERRRGSQFDPDVVAVALRLMPQLARELQGSTTNEEN